MPCKYCEPYREEWFKGTNGDAVVTKYAELVAFPDTDFEVYYYNNKKYRKI